MVCSVFFVQLEQGTGHREQEQTQEQGTDTGEKKQFAQAEPIRTTCAKYKTII